MSGHAMYCELGLYPGLDVLGAGLVLWPGRAGSGASQVPVPSD